MLWQAVANRWSGEKRESKTWLLGFAFRAYGGLDRSPGRLAGSLMIVSAVCCAAPASRFQSRSVESSSSEWLDQKSAMTLIPIVITCD
jgi:hypothetical protein